MYIPSPVWHGDLCGIDVWAHVVENDLCAERIQDFRDGPIYRGLLTSMATLINNRRDGMLDLSSGYGSRVFRRMVFGRDDVSDDELSSVGIQAAGLDRLR
jgi:hypothetical protein